jgi:hypothetical protein
MVVCKKTVQILIMLANNVYTLECSTISSHDHVTLLIQNLLDTPIHVYKPSDFTR